MSAPSLETADGLCECSRWARTDGRLTNHHPRCSLFKQERFVKIRLHSGSIYTQPADDLSPLMEEIKDAYPGEKWTLELVEMTREEFDRLPEFTGH